MKTIYSTLAAMTAVSPTEAPSFAKTLQHITKKCGKCGSIFLIDSPDDVRYMADLDTGIYYYGNTFLLYANCPVCDYAVMLEGYLNQGNPAIEIQDNLAKAPAGNTRLRPWCEEIPLALRTKAYRKWEKEQTPKFWAAYFSHWRMQRWIEEHPRDARKLQARLIPQGSVSS